MRPGVEVVGQPDWGVQRQADCPYAERYPLRVSEVWSSRQQALSIRAGRVDHRAWRAVADRQNRAEAPGAPSSSIRGVSSARAYTGSAAASRPEMEYPVLLPIRKSEVRSRRHGEVRVCVVIYILPRCQVAVALGPGPSVCQR